MNSLIFPDIFNSSVSAFFTRKFLGAHIEEICDLLSIQRGEIYFPIQRHTDKIHILNSDLRPEIADAVITERKGVLIGVQVADCVPILLNDRRRSVVGAVHAGWRGTAAQIIKKTIELMHRNFHSFPEDIKIALGPSIRWSCYEVGEEVIEAIYKATGEGEYFLQRDGGYCVDLPTANMYQALSMGIPEENIWVSNECTYCSPMEYYSSRFSKGHTGKQGGFIGILKT